MAVSTVAITGHVLAPDGTAPTSGRITAKLSAPGSALDGTESVRVATEVTDDLATGGAASLALVPNDAITPSGTYYLVTFIVGLATGRRVQWSERWQVPSGGALDIGAVPRLDAVPGVAVTTVEAVQAGVLASATASASSASASAAAAAASAALVQDFLYERVTQPVTLSPADGTSTISATLEVTLSTLAVGATIYYTTDGSKPDATSAVYSAPFDLAAGALVRAVAYLDATGFSEVTEAEYQVNVEVRLPLDTPGDFAQGATMGSGSTSTAVTTTRTTTAGTYVDGAGATQSVAASHLRVGARGIISEQNATQSFVTPLAPATQSPSLGTGTFTLWVEGSGQIAAAVGTATATGLPATVIEGHPATFVVTGAGTVVLTVSGTLTFAQLENRLYPTSHIQAAGLRANEVNSFPAPVDVSSGRLKFTIRPAWTDVLVSSQYLFGTGSGSTVLVAYFAVPTSNNPRAIQFYAGSGLLAVVPEVFFGRDTEHTLEWEVGLTSGAVIIDGVRRVTTGSPSPASGTTFYLGGSNVGGGPLEVSIKDIQIGGVKAIPRRNPKAIAALGDSITLDASTNGGGNPLAMVFPWPKYLCYQRLVAGQQGYIYGNFGVGGNTTTQMLTRWRVSADIRDAGYGTLVLMGGTNDLSSGVAVDTVYDNLHTIWTEAIAAGMHVVPILVLPNHAIKLAGYESRRLDLNARISAWCASAGVVCVNGDSLGDGTGDLIAGNTSDGTHLSIAGSQALAALILPAIP